MTEGQNDGQAENSIPPLKLRFAGGITKIKRWHNFRS